LVALHRRCWRVSDFLSYLYWHHLQGIFITFCSQSLVLLLQLLDFPDPCRLFRMWPSSLEAVNN